MHEHCESHADSENAFARQHELLINERSGYRPRSQGTLMDVLPPDRTPKLRIQTEEITPNNQRYLFLREPAKPFAVSK